MYISERDLGISSQRTCLIQLMNNQIGFIKGIM